MSYLGKLENLSDVNHVTILFLPNLFKHKLKKKEKIYNQLKYKAKFVPIHAVKACKVSGCIVPVILNLGTRWRLVSITQA
jgi:amino acid permease